MHIFNHPQRFKITTFLLVLLTLGLFSSSKVQAEESRLIHTAIDYGRIVFTRKFNNQKDLYVLDFTTGKFSPLVTSPGADEYPTWSPDGSKIVFYSEMCGDREIFSIKDDGTELKRLTVSPGIDEDPDWSPDGKSIVFRSEREGPKISSIYSMRADGSGLKKIASGPGENSVPRWSPRGDEVIYSTNASWPGWDMLLVDLNSKEKTKLTDGYKSYSRASWHPSGGSFAFSYGAKNKADIWMFTKGQKKPVQITKMDGREFDPVFSDDGSKLFFTAEVNPGQKDYQLYIIDLKTKEYTQLTKGTPIIRHISWTSLPFIPAAEPVEGEASETLVTPNQGMDLEYIRNNVCATKRDEDTKDSDEQVVIIEKDVFTSEN